MWYMKTSHIVHQSPTEAWRESLAESLLLLGFHSLMVLPSTGGNEVFFLHHKSHLQTNLRSSILLFNSVKS